MSSLDRLSNDKSLGARVLRFLRSLLLFLCTSRLFSRARLPCERLSAIDADVGSGTGCCKEVCESIAFRGDVGGPRRLCLTLVPSMSRCTGLKKRSRRCCKSYKTYTYSPGLCELGDVDAEFIYLSASLLEHAESF